MSEDSKTLENTTKAVKFDGKKPMVALVEPQYILGTAQVMTFGMSKYGKDNWKQNMDDAVLRLYSAAMRHMLQFREGEVIDPESGLSHLYHASCNLMMLNWYIDHGALK